MGALRSYVAVFLACFVAGCVTITDITGEATDYGIDYVAGARYQLQQPVRVVYSSSIVLLGKLEPGSTFAHELLPTGTELQVEKIMREHNPAEGTFYHVRARIVTGRHAGLVVDITFLSENFFKPTVNASILRRVQ